MARTPFQRRRLPRALQRAQRGMVLIVVLVVLVLLLLAGAGAMRAVDSGNVISRRTGLRSSLAELGSGGSLPEPGHWRT